MVEENPVRDGEIAMALLGKDIPAIGPRLKTKRDAMLAVKEFVRDIEELVKGSDQPYRVMFLRQPDGRYMMVIKGVGDTLELLHNFDEITVKRFQRSFKKRLFIITGFFEEGNDLECLALTEGLGAVMYVP
ncbi:MAG: hypothetical protein VR68_07375 [Peptococcaceae bacterium BRH_c4a]|nr:MAG: hypothetical protein VR68_07375 [Peptococcaceae bacterium BRH_c4a]